MRVGDLYDLFRSDVADDAEPYLWTDNEVYRYMNDAYVMLVRMTGGIPDAVSSLTQIPIVAGVSYAPVSKLILKFDRATRASDGQTIKIINPQDEDTLYSFDYNRLVQLNPNTPGDVRFMEIGGTRAASGGQVKWVQQPVVNDTANLFVHRLPLDNIIDSTSDDFEFDEVNDEHHEHLMLWMKYRAYGKQDAETFDKGRRDDYKAAFEAYCEQVTNENNRYKSKVRVVRYGGI